MAKLFHLHQKGPIYSKIKNTHFSADFSSARQILYILISYHFHIFYISPMLYLECSWTPNDIINKINKEESGKLPT
jgi:hypothetical protein